MLETTSTGRYDFLDWLRVIAIALLLFFHTGMLFVGWGWHIVNAETIDWLEWPMDLAHRLRMPLLFVIAGAGLWYALRRRSARELVAERSLRLLLPLGIGMLVIVPPQIYFERLFRGQWSGSYWSFMFERVLEFRPYPEGDLSWHHLWFILYLYIYALLLVLPVSWWRRRATRLRPGLWLYAFSLLLGLNEALLKPLFPETHNLVRDWYTFNHYLLLTAFGVLLASLDAGWEWLEQTRRAALGFAVSFTLFLLVAFDRQLVLSDTPADAFVANVFTGSWLLTMLGYGKRHLSLDSSLLRWARDASYPIYILHQTLMIAIAYFVIQEPWSPGAKYWVVLGGTSLACVALYEAIVRRFVVTRVMFGMKPDGAGLSRGFRRAGAERAAP